MSVTDAHSSLYSSSSMTIHLTINHNTIKDVNKTTLKHLLSPSHRCHKESGKDVNGIWKHLYTACIFALRQEWGGREVEGERMLAVIKNSMTFLDIK